MLGIYMYIYSTLTLSLALFLNAGERAWIEYVDSLLLYLPLSEIPSHHFFNAIYVLEDMQINMFNLSLSHESQWHLIDCFWKKYFKKYKLLYHDK